MANTSNIRERMNVVGSCGNLLGTVDHIEGDQIKLTRNSSGDNQHHFIPTSWVASVDETVHLNKDCGAARREWSTEATAV